MSADPRDTARQWLAEVIDSVADLGLARHVIADAILSAPGVEVGEERGHEYVATGALVTHGGIHGPGPEYTLRPFARVVIRLPTEEGTGT